mgnify:CR=1 FL=1
MAPCRGEQMPGQGNAPVHTTQGINSLPSLSSVKHRGGEGGAVGAYVNF